MIFFSFSFSGKKGEIQLLIKKINRDGGLGEYAMY